MTAVWHFSRGGSTGRREAARAARPPLSRLFGKPEDEYELSERRLALERKLDLISRTAGTLLDLLQNQRSLRVEWYIVALIVMELAITVYPLVTGAR